MRQLYSKLTTKSYKLISTTCLLIADISIYIYLYLKFTNKEVFHKIMEIAMKSYPSAQGQVGPDFERQIYQLMVNTLLTMLALVFCYHSFVYLLWNKGKKFGHSYLVLYTIIAGPGSILVGLATLSGNILSGLFWLVVGALYTFVLLGLNHFREIIKETSHN